MGNTRYQNEILALRMSRVTHQSAWHRCASPSSCARVDLRTALLCHCYLSSEVGDVESQDGVTADGFASDVLEGDGAGPDGEQAHQPLRRTFLVMHDWVIEERRLDNPLEIVDSQEMPERLANIFSDNVHGQVIQLAATEHGFLFRYDDAGRHGTLLATQSQARQLGEPEP